MADDRVLFLDTTLRDGEQSAGIGMTADEKMEIARQLQRLRVDIIEAGFAASSPGDFQAVSNIAREVHGPIICSLARAVADDVDQAWAAIKHAERPRIHIFLSSSEIHQMHQLRKNREEVMDMAVAMVARAKGYCDDVEFSPMDATRTNPEYLFQMLEEVIRVGATTVNVADTVGYAIPSDFARLLHEIQDKVPSIDKATLSVHCHNDLGLAVSNSLAAIQAGARQVEGCINGIGERAGNASLEEIIMAVDTRKDLFTVQIGIDTTQLYPASRLVSRITGMAVQSNKAVVGENAFRHASGIHQDGVIKMPITYEIIDPKMVGISASSLVLGKLSGRHAFKERLAELGYSLSDEDFSRAFAVFKQLAEKKKTITNKDIESLVAEEQRTVSEIYHLDRIQVSCGDRGIPTAAVRLTGPEGQVIADAALGTGPVDAIYKAINRLVGVTNKLTEFSVKSVTEGIDAIGEVLIRVESDGVTYTGRGADTDIIVASAKAYINALNRLLTTKKTTE